MEMDSQTKELFEHASKVRENAYAPISKFKVGSAVLAANGKIYVGCNVESATFTNTTHAETNAIDTAVADGQVKIVKILIITSSPSPLPPCALCRQKIAEHSDDAEIISATVEGDFKTQKITELYPEPFTLNAI